MKRIFKKWEENWLEIFLASAGIFLSLHFFYIALALTLYGPQLGIR